MYNNIYTRDWGFFMAKKIFFHLHTGYCGEDAYEVVEFEDDATDEQISDCGYDMAMAHAASYGRELCDADCEDEDCEMEHPGNTNIEGSWEIYNPEKHNIHSSRGDGTEWNK